MEEVRVGGDRDRCLVLRLEGVSDRLGVVAEVENEGVVLAGVDAVEARERLHGGARERLSTYIVWSSGWSKPVWNFSATISTWYVVGVEPLAPSALSGKPFIRDSVYVDAVVVDRAGEGHQRFDVGVAVLGEVAVDRLLVADGVQPRAM